MTLRTIEVRERRDRCRPDIPVGIVGSGRQPGYRRRPPPAAAEYEASRFWTAGSIAVMRLSLVIFRLLSVGALACALCTFVVFQSLRSASMVGSHGSSESTAANREEGTT